MPPAGVKSAKRKRQYEHIKESARKRGQGGRAEEIAARTVNKQRAEAGETKGRKSRGSSSGTSAGSRRTSRGKGASSSRTKGGARKTTGRKRAQKKR